MQQRNETNLVKIWADYISTLCCLQETKCPGGFDERSGNYRHIGLPSQLRHYGLAFSVAIQFENQIVRYWSVSDRIAVIQLRISNNSILTIISVHGPTSQRVNNNNPEQDEFYAELARYSSSALFYIAGDFNSTIGHRKDDENFMGHHSRGRNIFFTSQACFFSLSNASDRPYCKCDIGCVAECFEREPHWCLNRILYFFKQWLNQICNYFRPSW